MKIYDIDDIMKSYEAEGKNLMGELLRENDKLKKRVVELTDGLTLAIKLVDSHVHNEYDGTSMLEELLAEADPAREALKGKE